MVNGVSHQVCARAHHKRDDTQVNGGAGQSLRASLYELEQMQQWEREYAPLTFIPVVQEPEADWCGKSGLVHKAIMDDFVSLHDYDIYVAGRFEMAGAAREEFKILGAEPERIFGDAYEFI